MGAESETKNKKDKDRKKSPVRKPKTKMKTAIDVIHRIQWDEALDTTEFVVGYIDRFRGILEKPFSDFTFKDVVDIDYDNGDEFGVPQHRIHYFKWQNILVWNKETRIDFVFGSGEGHGKKIDDIIAENTKEKSKNTERKSENPEGNSEIVEGQR